MNSKLKTEMLDFRLVKPNKSNVVKSWRNRQTLWGGRTDANPKLLLNDT